MTRAFQLSLLTALVVGLTVWTPALGSKQKKAAVDDDIDYVELAARLVRDGHYDRAAIALSEVKETDEGIDLARLFLLRGLVSMDKELYADAADNFQKAIDAGASDPVVQISLAQAKFHIKDYAGAVSALDRAGDVSLQNPRAESLRARSQWELGQRGPALDVLARASARFPDRAEFPRLEMFYLLELELFQELASRRTTFLKRTDITAEDVAAICEATRRAGHLEDAQRTAEAGRLRFPDDEPLTVLLARILMDGGHVLSSAMVLEELARTHPKYRVEAAELYRRAGRLDRALFVNAQVGDQKQKMRQRLQILLEMERFEMIAAMDARLSRLGLLSDEQIRYALAYGYFMIGDFDTAERHLASLTDPELFTKSVELRKAIGQCEQQGWACH